MKLDKLSAVNKLKDPKFRYSSMYTFIIILVIIVVVLLNIAAKMCTDKFSWEFDITKNKAFSLTEDSINYLAKLDKHIEITVLNSQEKFVSNGDYFAQANSVINEYSKYNDKISVKYVELEQNPGIKSSYSEEELSDNGIIVKCVDNGRYKILSANDIFDVQQSYMGMNIASSKAEQTMTSAIAGVISDEKIKVTMLTGFEEMASDAFTRMLKNNNYDVVSKSMLTDDIDEDSNLAIIYAPARDLDDQAVSKIKEYLKNKDNYGKNVVCFINPYQSNPEKLNSLLSDWGIEVQPGIVLETDPSKVFASNNFFNTLTSYVSMMYTQKLKSQAIPVAMPISRPIKILNEEKVETLLEFSKSSCVMPEDADEKWTINDAKIKGPIPAMVLSTEKKEDFEEKSTFTLVG
ncbi:MAG: GldG family protein, partial [Oscillospiraceae bacterium]|nr:GldG family protein [Oscillospiraceae bacterium]